ncbi:MAG: hypothetical protein ACK5QX_08495 [bacterium]
MNASWVAWQARAARASAPRVPQGMSLVPTVLLGRFPELNPSNYDHDDACALNAWGAEVVLAAAPQPKGGQS